MNKCTAQETKHIFDSDSFYRIVPWLKKRTDIELLSIHLDGRVLWGLKSKKTLLFLLIGKFQNTKFAFENFTRVKTNFKIEALVTKFSQRSIDITVQSSISTYTNYNKQANVSIFTKIIWYCTVLLLLHMVQRVSLIKTRKQAKLNCGDSILSLN